MGAVYSSTENAKPSQSYGVLRIESGKVVPVIDTAVR
jgi:hypothetical protein